MVPILLLGFFLYSNSLRSYSPILTMIQSIIHFCPSYTYWLTLKTWNIWRLLHQIYNNEHSKAHSHKLDLILYFPHNNRKSYQIPQRYPKSPNKFYFIFIFFIHNEKFLNEWKKKNFPLSFIQIEMKSRNKNLNWISFSIEFWLM